MRSEFRSFVKAAVAGAAASALLLGAAGSASALPTPAPLPTPVTMAALGDSITIGYDATKLLAAQPEYSWATGTSSTVNSMANRLEARSATTSLTAANWAVKGAKSAELAGQTSHVTSGTDLVTVLIGANDACTSTESTMTSVTTFRSQIDATLSSLAKANVDQVVVTSVPDVYRLWSIGHTNPSARFIWGLAGICKSMLANPLSTRAADESRRQRVRQRVIDFNAQLKAACDTLAATSKTTACAFDGNAVFATPFVASDISTVDYFHPSPAGQGKIAATVYQAVGFGLAQP